MKRLFRRVLNCIVVFSIAFAFIIPAAASSISDLQRLINDQQNKIDAINNNIGGWEDEVDLLEEEISDLDAEIVNTLTSIGLLEDEIAQKELDIEDAQERFIAAKEKQEEQYAAMKIRIQYMYESGEESYLVSFLSAESFSDILDRATNIEALYEYDHKMQLEYIANKEEIASIWAQLEIDKEELEADKVELVGQKEYLDTILAKKKKDASNYETMISKARQEAALYVKKIQQEQAQIKKLQDQAKRNTAATNGNYTVTQFNTSIIDNASGSENGKKLAKYACQFIGNPYVSGGTSLTNGADCSGFVYRLYSDFNYSVARTSYQLRSEGKEVAYADAQPGDIICYDGHVGIYVGGGYIVHASTAKTGIKVSNANYRTILSVRRVF